MNKITYLLLCLLLTGCTQGMNRAVVFDADNKQLLAAEYPAGSTVKYKGEAGELEVSAPPPKAPFIQEVVQGVGETLLPILMINAIND